MDPQLLSKVYPLLTVDTYFQTWWICFSFDLCSFFFLIFLHSVWVICGFLSHLWSSVHHSFELCFLVVSTSAFTKRCFLLSQFCVISQVGTAILTCPMDMVVLVGGGYHTNWAVTSLFHAILSLEWRKGWNVSLHISTLCSSPRKRRWNGVRNNDS